MRILTLCVVVAGCGSETTDLIPRLQELDAPSIPGPVANDSCVDATSYPGGGYRAADAFQASDLVLNGDAQRVDAALRLASETETVVGSAYVAQPVSITDLTSIFVHFSMVLSGGDGAEGGDGLAVVIQNSENGSQALGWLGEGLGYRGVEPSVGVEFDTYQNETDPEIDHVALILNGDTPNHQTVVHPDYSLNDGVRRFVWVDYDAELAELAVFVSESATKPANALLTHANLDLSRIVGEQAYLGLSASSGAVTNQHDVLGELWFATSELPKCR